MQQLFLQECCYRGAYHQVMAPDQPTTAAMQGDIAADMYLPAHMFIPRLDIVTAQLTDHAPYTDIKEVIANIRDIIDRSISRQA